MKKVEALLERARTDALSPEDMERLWQSVVAGGGPGGPGLAAGPEGTAPAAKASGVVLKAGVGLVVAGGLAALVFARSTSRPVAAPAGAPPTGHAATAPAQVAAPGEIAEAPAPAVAWDNLPRAHGEGEGSPKASRPRPERAAAPLPASPAIHAAPAEVPARPEIPETVEAPAEAPVAAAPSEGALLLQARRQLASDPGAALALTGEASRRFPDGPLAPEREVLAIEALAKLGQSGEARNRLAAFRARYPQSPHLARLQSLLEP